ncbi:uncharacterized protein Dmoj_GI17004 [Drosophila mojavensis]|uniref:Uncharacterized protein n=1 Tax=Drosophila mojavensis TaxID=7230 RepID=B4KGW3_DROMO|nr:uncharacterized protein Dmoj_GI17004 [Drosophila mojavensis]
MPMSDVAAALIYTEQGNGKHAKSQPTTIATTTTGATGAAAAGMTNSSKSDSIGGAAAAAAQLGNMLSPSLSSMQGQKWQQVFDLDKVIKQLRAAEKTHLRGNNKASSAGGSAAPHVVQVQRLNASDMAYYDMVPKLAARDIVVCNACNGSYTKAGFNNHIALQHPSIWDAAPNKLSSSAAGATAATVAAVADSSQDGELLGSPTDTLSATMSSCSNGSSSSLAAINNSNNTNISSASSSSSSRHKSSSSKSSSSSKTGSSSSNSSSTGRSRSKSSKNRHHSDVHHTKVGGSKKSSAIATAATAPAPVAAAAVAAVKEELPTAAGAQPAITVFSSSSNSSCSLPPTPATVAGNGNGNEHGINYSPANNMLDEQQQQHQPSKKKLKTTGSGEATSHHRSKPAKEKQLAPIYEQQQLSELDQAVSSITGQVNVEQLQQRHQVDLSAATEEALPLMQNASDDNSISLTLDMLDSKFINEILNTVESDLPFDESALDTSQQQQQQQQQLSADQLEPNTKRLRFDDGTIQADAAEYAAALYQQQQQQHGQQVYTEEPQQTQLSAMDAMQLQQLIYQQQQMLEQADQQQQQQQQLKQEELQAEATAQFSVYNVPSLTDDVEETAQVAGDEQLMLPSIIYEITDNNQVSVLDQQSQQQVIAEFLTQAGYDNVDVNVNVNVLQEGVNVGGSGGNQMMYDELGEFDFSKLETVSGDANNHTKTVKLENNQPQQQQQPLQPTGGNSNGFNHFEGVLHAQPHRQLANAKYHEDSTYFNMTLYSGPPRPLAMNTFGLVKLPNGMGATLRKNLLTTRKANNSLLSLNGSSGVVGTLARAPPPPPTVNCNGSSNGSQQLLLPRVAAGQGKTIYAQRCSVIAQERLRCNKRALLSKLSNGSSLGNSAGNMTVKRLQELLAGKLKPEKEKEKDKTDYSEASEQQLQQQQQEENKRMHSFYEKRRKLLATRQHRHLPIGGGGVSNNRPFKRQRPMHLPLQLHGHSNNSSHSNNNAIGSPQQHDN